MTGSSAAAGGTIVRLFKGIPTRRLRSEACAGSGPSLPHRGTDVRDATQWANRCPQGSSSQGTGDISEDCGYTAHSALTAESEHDASGNYGTLDLIALLEWVQANIEAFGGDPDNVLIFGESGGGTKTLSLLSSPLAKGLFHKAIIESGSALISPERATTLESAEAAGEKIAAKLGPQGKDDLFRSDRHS